MDSIAAKLAAAPYGCRREGGPVIIVGALELGILMLAFRFTRLGLTPDAVCAIRFGCGAGAGVSSLDDHGSCGVLTLVVAGRTGMLYAVGAPTGGSVGLLTYSYDG